MFRLKTLLVITFAVGISAAGFVWASAARPAMAAPAAQSGELLTNPGLEAFMTADGKFDYPVIQTTDGGGHVAEGWLPWWYNDAGVDYSVPEYDIAPITRDPYRVRSGNAAQQLFRPSVLWQAGIYQTVTVPTNANLQFSIWGHAWASFCRQNPKAGKEGEPDVLCNSRNSHEDNANPGTMRIGIDPTGGTDWTSSNVVWSPDTIFYDNFGQLVVTAQAKSSTVTVFTYTTFVYPAPINNVYWDDASLIVAGQGSGGTSNSGTPQPTSAAPPVGGSGAIPTQPPNPDGSQHHIVKAGDTLGGIGLAYGVTVQQIRELNGLTGDNIVPGQDLLIKEASLPTPTPTLEVPPTEEVTAEATATAEEVAEVQTGKICLTMFDDVNSDGIMDEGEGMLASGIFNLSGNGAGTYTTTGMSEPYCFETLAAGAYLVQATAPAGYTLTGRSEMPVTLATGSDFSLNFGAISTIPEPTVVPTEEALSSAASSRSTLIAVGAGAGVLTLGAGIGLAVYFLVYKKKVGAAESE
jgi:LysM repeat protein